jgi:hypothetical protein
VASTFGSISFAADGQADDSVAVIRGSSTSTQRKQKSAKPSTQRTATSTKDESVVVMRPASGSFMRETNRLAAEAEVREQRAAAEEARAVNQRAAEALEAAKKAADAVQSQPPGKHQVLVPLGHGIRIDPKTRQLYDPAGNPIPRKAEPK